MTVEHGPHAGRTAAGHRHPGRLTEAAVKNVPVSAQYHTRAGGPPGGTVFFGAVAGVRQAEAWRADRHAARGECRRAAQVITGRSWSPAQAGTKNPHTPFENSPAANLIGGDEPVTSYMYIVCR